MLVSYPDSFRLEESKSLVESADCKVMEVFTQKYLNHSEFGLGSGKAEEISQFVKDFNEKGGRGDGKIDQIVVDEHLTSKQIYNLEKLIGVPTIDRERLILNIFSSRATTTEARLQIELAEIRYEMPRVRENAKLTSGGERAGRGGMGEYVVDVKFRDLKRRISFISEKLDQAKKKRMLYQQQREKTGLPVVSLVGYTSSGKTTLFNLLTSESKRTASSLFTTLSTTTRVLKMGGVERPARHRGNRNDVLLTDTVGFISRLPTYMIDAFKSTLEESLAADLILLLLDASESLQDIRIKYSSSWDVLQELQVEQSKVVVILTKQDRLGSEEAIEQIAKDLNLPSTYGSTIAISSKTGYGIHNLRRLISQACSPQGIPVKSGH